MQRYRSRPVECSAFQFDPDVFLPPGVRIVDGYDRCEYVTTTVHGQETIDPGDWIVITDDGNWRKCTREAFEAGFEPVDKHGQTAGCITGIAGFTTQ